MLSEQDEFLVSQLLDGDLPAVEADALRARIARDPALREALAHMRRLDDVLRDRRSSQPRVDLAALHAEIMGMVEDAGQPAIIRFPLWKRAAGLLAAAAAIVLFFSVYRPAGMPNVNTPIQVAQVRPSPQPQQTAPVTTPSIVALAQNPDIPNENVRVRFNRPSPQRANGSSLKVNYVRSDTLATAMKARDDERRSRPTVSVVVSQRPKSRVGAVASPFDAPL